MNVKKELIQIAGKIINRLGEREQSDDYFPVCPFIGYQPQRPFSQQEQTNQEQSPHSQKRRAALSMEQLAVFYDSIQKSVDHLAPDNVLAQEFGPKGQEPQQDQ